MALASLIWLAVGLALLGIESLGGEFDGLMEGAVAALVVSVLSALLPWPPLFQVVAFAGLSSLGLLALRRWDRRSRGRTIPPGSQSAEVIAGFEGVAEGRVRWQGQSWAAINLEETQSLPLGTTVTVMGRDGNHLQVLAAPIDDDPAGH